MGESEDRRVRPFAGWLQELRRGALHDEVSVALNDVVEAVQMYRKPGSITLTFNIKPVGAKDNVMVSDDVKVKLPGPDRPEALFFVDEEFNLTRSDPRQMEIPAVREVLREPDAKVREEEKA